MQYVKHRLVTKLLRTYKDLFVINKELLNRKKSTALERLIK